MRRRTSVLAASTALLCAGGAIAAVGLPAASAASSASAPIPGSAAPSQVQQHPVGAVDPSSQVNFSLVLKLRDPSGAQALVKAVSTPGNAQYRHFLTTAQWEARFSPTAADVQQAESWLRSEGFTVGAPSKDRITISASGTAAQVESAFGTSLENYQVKGATVRGAASNLSVPSSLSGIVAGTLGINQHVATPADASNPDIPGSASAGSSSSSTSGGGFPPPPGAFLRHPPCSPYYGANTTTLNPPFGHGYPNTVPDVVCGYRPGQLRSAYGVSSLDAGKGTTVAVIDAYGSATMAQDATEYFAKNDPQNPFSKAAYHQIIQGPFQNESLCAASGWATEQAIDVESVHSTAPAAHILYVGAQDCINGLFNAEQTVIDGHLADVVTNSWADTGGDLLDDAAYKTAFDDLFMMADSTGMTIQFSSGDDGDNFYLLGFSSADYPSVSPYVTAVGGTTLQVGANGQRMAELGWDTGRSFLCTQNLVGILCSASQLNTWLPATPDGISGGFTSYYYTQPPYQAGVVPADLALRNEAIDGSQPMRVIPDISAVADPGTGFLIGLQMTYPDGSVKYTETRYGGTSLASPVMAGLVADADSLVGSDVGFLNPTIYEMDQVKPSSIYDVLPEPYLEGNFREDFAGPLGLGLPTTGVAISFRELYYRGPETYCDATGNCATRQEPLTVTKGYDSLTGLGSPGTNFIPLLAYLGG